MEHNISQKLISVSDEVTRERKYWLNTLSGELVRSSFPYDFSRKFARYEQGVINFALPQDISKKILGLASQSDYNVFVVLVAAITALLQKYCGNTDLILGAPILKQKVEGEYINTFLALRNKVSTPMTFKELLIQTKRQVTEANENLNYPIERLFDQLDIPPYHTGYALFDVAVLLENIHDRRYIEHTEPNIMFTFANEAGLLRGALEYNVLLYRPETVERIISHLENLLGSVLLNKDIALAELSVMSREEEHQLFSLFNQTTVAHDSDLTIKRMFENQVARTPEKIAVVFEGQQLTYQELNEKANSLARVLQAKGVKNGSIVGILLERSMEMVIAILGIVKAGGAYLPIDPDYAEKRIRFFLTDSGAQVLLTQHDLLEQFTDGIEALDITDPTLYTNDCTNLLEVSGPEDLAYVIYTSGTTGQPKGVLIEQHNLLNYVNWFKRTANLTSEDKTALLSSYCFDLGYTALYPALLGGCELHLIAKPLSRDMDGLWKYFYYNSITYIKTTPTLFNLLIHAQTFEEPTFAHDLRLVVLGGEEINAYDVQRFHQVCPDVQIMNHYGPTEATIGSVARFIDFSALTEYIVTPTIGQPIDNARVYILNENLHPVPVGVAGELHIAGEGLARGYLNLPELNREKFILHSFSQESVERLYKTGDLARYLPDGTIQLLGRADNQVKIHGYRIELGEIENRLLSYPPVQEAVVLARKDANDKKILCAYLVSDQEIAQRDVREYLAQELPDYMIPSYFIFLNTLPMTPNGKVDTKALPEPDKNLYTHVRYAEPRNNVEATLVEICRSVFEVEQIGINDSFFDLGGDSIKAIQIASRLQKHNYKLDINNLFQHPVLGDVSSYIQLMKAQVDQGPVSGKVALAPSQKKFFERQYTNMHHWNQSVMLYSANGFDEQIVRRVFTKIVEHHDALRMVYRWEDGELIQFNRGLEGELFTFEAVDLTLDHEYEAKIVEEANRLQGSIDLAQGPLVKLGLFKTYCGAHLLIAVHHLVMDGISWRIIFEDFTAGYQSILSNEDITLQDKTHSFKDWVATLGNFAQSEELAKEVSYWREVEQTEIQPLVKDHCCSENLLKDSASITMQLSEKQTEELLKNVNRAYNTEINDLLLTALGLTLQQWLKEQKILINLEGHGREHISDEIDVTRTIGWFTSNYPVILDMQYAENLSTQIKTVKEILRNIPRKGFGYGVLKYIATPEARKHLEFNLAPEISFNYLGQFDQDVSGDLFTFSSLSAGNSISVECKRPFTLNISCLIVQNKLTVTYDYSKNEYEEDTIRALVEDYLGQIGLIIEHCGQKDKVELTPHDLLYNKLSIRELEELTERYREWGEIENIYTLSPMQEAMLELYEKNLNVYFIERVYGISGNLNLEALEKSFALLIQRYDILRTSFLRQNGGSALQIVFKERTLDFHFADISNLSEEDKARYLEEYKASNRHRGFDLTADLLMRMAVLKLGQDRYKVIWSNHHIVIDGWCRPILIKELFATYLALAHNQPIEMEPAEPYSTFISWLNRENTDEARSYWQNYLRGYEQSGSLLPAGREKTTEYELQEHFYRIDEKQTAQLLAFAKKHEVTLNTVMQAIWGLVLQKLNNLADVTFGAVVSGRPSEIAGIEKMIGLFINVIPVRIGHADLGNFADLVKSVQKEALLAEQYDFVSLKALEQDSTFQPGYIDHALFFENYPVDKEVESLNEGLDFTFTDIEVFEKIGYDFNVFIVPGNTIMVKFSYNANVYSATSIHQIVAYLNEFIQAIGAL